MIDGGVTEIVVGASIGAVFGSILTELVDAVKRAKQKAKMFAPRMSELESILQYGERVVLCGNNNNNNKYVSGLRELMQEGKKLVDKCATFHRWEFVRRIRYQKKLLQLNKNLVAFLILYIQNQNNKFQNRNRNIFNALLNLQNNMIHVDMETN
ncbi:putative inactive receptor kinase [Senna tora]|uniref:Putative inactive receptor kinase n=1 Tax=Senna tora TaxID=362788 RepID=A0A834TP13_9FABA|nr:putative inactive receptor kinase [Senna tora]